MARMPIWLKLKSKFQMSQDKEKNNEDSVENIPNKEGELVVGSSLLELEQKAIEVAGKILDEPFNAFDPVSYLKEFYPDLNPGSALQIMQIIEDNENKEETKTTTDIRIIRELFSNESTDLGEKSLESLENCCILDFMLRKAVPEILKDRPEDHLKILDIGGGPTIYQHIPLMGIADKITHSEYLSGNREEIKRWKEGTSSFDWKSFFSTYQLYLKSHPDIAGNANEEVQNRFKEMVSEETSVSKLEDELRRKINDDILPCDVSREDLGMGNIEQAYDLINIGREGSAELITSNFCIESIKDSQEFWQSGIENVTSKVPKDGFFLMTAIRNATWYKVGEETMPAYPVNAENIRVELEKQGFEIKIMSELVGSEKEVIGYDGMVFVLAKRIEG